jgi:glycosyltransferase involved in cell wall biosynthesis
MSMAAPFSIVCISSQEWREHLPTNRQQIMLRAARRGHDVLFVEAGHFFGKHLWRLLRGPERRSLARRLFSTEEVLPNVRLRKDVNLLPWGTRYRIASRLNALPTGLLLTRLTRGLPQPAVLWLYHPTSVTLAGRCNEALVVYDCVDDYAEQAGDHRRAALIAREDARTGRTARLVFATTTTLYERHRATNEQTHLVPNVADYEHFARAADATIKALEVSRLARPVIGFAGNFTGSKVDFDLIAGVAQARPNWTILLIGPADDASSKQELQRLAGKANVDWVGRQPYEDLPRYIAAFDVGIIPYVSNAYTRSCFPLKLYEYLAAGKPVVASGLPDLAGMEPDVVLVDGLDEFVHAVQQALNQGGSADIQRRQTLAAQNTWDDRAERLLELVSGVL